MSQCIEPKYGDMLHAFELGILPEHEVEQFEIHLFQCDYCFEKALEMTEATGLLREDNDIKDSIKKISKKKATSESLIHKVLTVLWPEKRFLLARPASILIMLILISFPVYKLLFEQSSTLQQTVNLFPMRGAEQNTIALEKNGDVIINFVYEQVIPGRRYNIVLVSREGDVIYSDSSFSRFNDQGLGSISLNVEKFKKGGYMLKIIDPSSTDPESKAVYYFRVE